MDAAPIPVETLLAHREWVRAVALAVVRDPNAADDVEQETWLAALRTPPRHATSLRGWLGAVARSRARRIGRGETRREAREIAASRGEATSSAAELAEIADTHRRVVQAVVELTEPYRETILLRYFEGLAVEVVAARTGVPLNTARARISRGLAQLRERLSRELGRDDRPWHLALVPLIRAGRTPAAAPAAVAIAVAAAIVITAGAAVAWRWTTADVDEVAVVKMPAAPAVPAPPPSRDDAPKPKPRTRAAEEPAPAPLPETVEQKLARTKVSIDWNDKPLMEALGDLAARAGVEIVVDADLAAVWERDSAAATIDRLKFDDIAVRQTLAVATMLKGLRYVVEGARVVVLEADAARDPASPVVVPPKPGERPDAAKTLTVKGVVVDERGAPVAHAEIVGVRGADRAPLGETDDAGAFDVALARPFPRIFASVRGHVPSLACEVAGAYGETVEVRLALGAAAAVIEGHVTDADGCDVADADIYVSSRDASREDVEITRPGKAPVLTPVRTDAQGRFRCESVPAGRLEISVYTTREFEMDGAKGRTRVGIGTSRVEARPSETLHAEVRLPRQIAWRGTLRDREGRPLSGVLVQALGYGGARTAADGSFVVTGLMPGWITVWFTLPGKPRIERCMRVEPGADFTWDPVIGAGFRIAGHVAGGAGLRVWMDPVLPWAGHRHASEARTTEGGQFVFEDAEPGRYRLTAVLPTGFFLASYDNEIASSRDDIVLRIPPGRQPMARIRARLVAADGSPAEGVTFNARQIDPAGNWGEYFSAPNGTATTPALPPGRYRVWARTPWRDGCQLLDAGVHDVKKTDVDLGRLTMPAPRRVRIAWQRQGDCGEDELMVKLHFVARDGERFPVRWVQRDAVALPSAWQLAPGRYVVRVTGEKVQGIERTFDVAGDADTTVDLPIVAAPSRRIALRFPLGPPACGRIRIRDAAGGFVHESVMLDPEFAVPLVPGTYRVDVDVTETTTVTGTLEVPAANAPERFEVALR